MRQSSSSSLFPQLGGPLQQQRQQQQQQQQVRSSVSYSTSSPADDSALLLAMRRNNIGVRSRKTAPVRVYIKLVNDWSCCDPSPLAPTADGAAPPPPLDGSEGYFDEEGRRDHPSVNANGQGRAYREAEEGSALEAGDDCRGGSDDAVGQAPSSSSGGGVVDEALPPARTPSRAPWEHSTILTSNYAELYPSASAASSTTAAQQRETTTRTSSLTAAVSEAQQQQHGSAVQGANDNSAVASDDFYSPVAARRIDLDAQRLSSASDGGGGGRPPQHPNVVRSSSASRQHSSAAPSYNTTHTLSSSAPSSDCPHPAYHPSWDCPFVIVDTMDLSEDTIDACVIKAMSLARGKEEEGKGEVDGDKSGQAHTRRMEKGPTHGRRSPSASSMVGTQQQRSSYASPSTPSVVLSSYDVFLGDKNGYICGLNPKRFSTQRPQQGNGRAAPSATDGGGPPNPLLIGCTMNVAYAAAAAAVIAASSSTTTKTDGTCNGVGDYDDLRTLHSTIVDSYSDYAPLPSFAKLSTILTAAALMDNGGDENLGGSSFAPLNMRRSLVVVPKPPRQHHHAHMQTQRGAATAVDASSSNNNRGTVGGALSGFASRLRRQTPSRSDAGVDYSPIYSAMNARIAQRHGMCEKHFARIERTHRDTVVSTRREGNVARIAEGIALRQLQGILKAYKVEDTRLMHLGLAKKAKEDAERREAATANTNGYGGGYDRGGRVISAATTTASASDGVASSRTTAFFGGSRDDRSLATSAAAARPYHPSMKGRYAD